MSLLKDNFEELWRNKKIFSLYLIFMIFSQFLLQYKETIWPKLYIGLAILTFFMLLSLSRLNNEKQISRNAFVLIAILGTLNALILPIRQNLDENTHYYHALEVADGKFRNQTNEKNFLMISPDFLAVTKLPSKPEYGNPLNTNLYHKDFLELKHIPSDYKEELLDVGGFNNPVYIPSALGIVLGRLVSDKVAVSYYLGRIFNVLFYAFLVWLAIKISKKYKLQIFVTSMIPYALWISSGFTYDNLYYGLILLVLAQITNFLGEEKFVTLKNIAKYSLTCLGLVFCKAPTILLIFLPIFLPKNSYKDSKERFKTIIITGFFSCVGFLWLIQGKLFKLFSTQAETVSQMNTTESTNIDMGYFLSHPIYTIELVLRSFSDMIVTIFGSIQKPQPALMPVTALSVINGIAFILLFLLITLQVKIQAGRIFKFAFVTIFLVITLGIFYAITGDPRVFKIGDVHISGVQGRYHFYILGFIPLFIAPLIQSPSFTINNFSTVIDENKLTIFVMKFVFIIAVLNTTVALYGYL